MMISTNDIYFVSVYYQGNLVDKAVNPIAEGISVFRETGESNAHVWGYTSWFDKLFCNMKTVAIVKEPEVFGRNIRALTNEDLEYLFEFVTIEIFEKHLRHLFQNEIPKFPTNESVQNYLKDLNPYE